METKAQGGVVTRAVSYNKYRLVLGTVKGHGLWANRPKIMVLGDFELVTSPVK